MADSGKATDAWLGQMNKSGQGCWRQRIIQKEREIVKETDQESQELTGEQRR